MSKAIRCDQCETTLRLNARGEDADGESSAWLVLTLTGDSFDFCTRSCLKAFLDEPSVIEAHDAYVETITGIARLIRDGGEDDDA